MRVTLAGAELEIRRSIERRIASTFRHFSLELSRNIGKEQLDKFFSRIRPVSTQCELIRVGAEGDGGYLIPDDLEGVKACFSPGIGKIVQFELALAERGIPSYLADFSVEGPPISSEYFEFDKKFIGAYDDDDSTTLDRWMAEKNIDSDQLILQMDIEGSEYDVLFQSDREVLRKFRIIVIEFHHLNRMAHPGMFKLIDNSFSKLLRDFQIVHIHPNNCAKPVRIYGYEIPPVMEFTLYRKDRIRKLRDVTDFPHRLDRKNVEENEDITLPKCWF